MAEVAQRTERISMVLQSPVPLPPVQNTSDTEPKRDPTKCPESNSPLLQLIFKYSTTADHVLAQFNVGGIGILKILHNMMTWRTRG